LYDIQCLELLIDYFPALKKVRMTWYWRYWLSINMALTNTKTIPIIMILSFLHILFV
jgi:hypothetical protein